MRHAKDRLDIGLLSSDPAMIEFIATEVGLGEPDHLPIADGVDQHRFDANGSVVKVNIVERLDVERRSGYTEVLIADTRATQPRILTGPDDVRVSVAPPGYQGVEQLGVRVHVPEIALSLRYFGYVLGWEVDESKARLGASILLLEEDAGGPRCVEMPVRGWTYLTVQVHDCDAETTAAVERGARLAQAPANMRDVARFSMVADPWGNQLEISQRASLTGPLSA